MPPATIQGNLHKYIYISMATLEIGLHFISRGGIIWNYFNTIFNIITYSLIILKCTLKKEIYIEQ